MALSLDLDQTYGLAYVGIIVAAILYGVSLLQAFIYFMQGRNDSKLIQGIVVFLLIVETVHQALLTHVGYYYLIQNYGNPFALGYGVWSISSSVFCNAAVAFVVEMFLVYRLYLMSEGNKLLCTLVAILVLAHLGTHLAWPIQALHERAFTKIVDLTSTAVTGFALAAAADTIIAGFLAWHIWRFRTGFRKSDSIISKLVLYTITSGAITSINSVINLIVYVVFPDKFWFVFFNFLACKLYTNCLISTLNSRDHIRETAGTELSTLGRSGQANTRSQRNLGKLEAGVGDQVHIHVRRSMVTGCEGKFEDPLNSTSRYIGMERSDVNYI